eukprot:9260293-Pyramimonas_sp.AAC.1
MLTGILKDPQCARRAPSSDFRGAQQEEQRQTYRADARGALKEARPNIERRRARRRGPNVSLTQQRAALSRANARCA